MNKPTIRAGTTFLDTNYPGWFKAINLEELDMSDAIHCVIGQIATEVIGLTFDERTPVVPYSQGCTKMGLNTGGRDVSRLHFTLGYGIQSFETLTKRWTAAIERRLRSEKEST